MRHFTCLLALTLCLPAFVSVCAQQENAAPESSAATAVETAAAPAAAQAAQPDLVTGTFDAAPQGIDQSFVQGTIIQGQPMYQQPICPTCPQQFYPAYPQYQVVPQFPQQIPVPVDPVPVPVPLNTCEYNCDQIANFVDRCNCYKDQAYCLCENACNTQFPNNVFQQRACKRGCEYSKNNIDCTAIQIQP